MRKGTKTTKEEKLSGQGILYYAYSINAGIGIGFSFSVEEYFAAILMVFSLLICVFFMLTKRVSSVRSTTEMTVNIPLDYLRKLKTEKGQNLN